MKNDDHRDTPFGSLLFLMGLAKVLQYDLSYGFSRLDFGMSQLQVSGLLGDSF